MLSHVSLVLQAWLDTGASFLYPEVCQCCSAERATAAESFVGETCRTAIRFIRPPFCERCGLPFEGKITTPFECANCADVKLHFQSARSVVAARGVALELIHRYKYGRAMWLEKFLGELFAREAASVLRAEAWDGIVPVPLHPLKEREREFNQSERLARYLGRALDRPVFARVLRRIEPTRTQTKLSRDERAANVQRAFACADAEPIRGQRVVLVDDVFTTGATTNACAKVLRAAGAQAVCVWTLARGLIQ